MESLLANYSTIDAFRLLANSMPQIVWTAKPDGTIDYYNKKWYEYTGSDENLLEQNWSTIIHPDDVLSCFKAWTDALENGIPYEIEARYRNYQGLGYRWFLARALPIMDQQGNVIRWFGTSTDIDDLKQTQQKLQQSENSIRRSQRELQSLTENLPDIITRYDRDLRCQFISRASERFSGKQTADYIGKTHREMGMSEDRSAQYDVLLTTVFETGKPVAEEIQIPGMDVWFHTVVVPEFDVDGNISTALSVSRNITERKLAELALSRSREQLKLISDTVPVFIVHCDIQKRFKFVNKAYADRFGLTPEECIGKSLSEMMGHKAFQSISQSVENVLLGIPGEFEGVVPYDKLGKLFMHATHSPEFDIEGNVLGFVSAISNITERKQAELALKELEERLASITDSQLQIANDHRQGTTSETISLTYARGFRNINKSEITHLEAVNGYALIHLIAGEKIMSSKNLTEYEKLLNDSTFQRIHRSFILNIAHFAALKTDDGVIALLTNGAEIPVARRLAKSLTERLKRVA